MTIRNDTDHEAGALVRFGLAYQRLAEEDEQRREWLNRHVHEPEPENDEEPPPRYKVDQPIDGRCKRWGCTKSIRCKGLCSEHYFQERWVDRRDSGVKHAAWLCRVCKTAWARKKGLCRKCTKALAHTHAESSGPGVEQSTEREVA